MFYDVTLGIDWTAVEWSATSLKDILVHSPDSFPAHGQSLPQGYTAQVSITSQVAYTTARVRDLRPQSRRCLYSDERDILWLGGYLQYNCVIQCHLLYTVRYCNCTPYFYPASVVFNNQKPQQRNPYFDDNVEGMQCDCMEDCNRYTYVTDVTLLPSGESSERSQEIVMDFHFSSHGMVLYRTDVIFGWSELVGAFLDRWKVQPNYLLEIRSDH
uniref:Uncharacterized protein n=1 Tax=Timema tahoe TaxID=61484 RepID=A0A7R9NWU3_9NEOP|nr:unnamed protein product [Timema tahoe]